MENGMGSYHRFLQGDRNAVEEFLRRYGDPLVRFAGCIVHDYAAAEDIAEDAFAVLIVKRKYFENETALKAYLYKIVRNRSIDFLRKRHRTVPLNEEILPFDEGEALAERRERNRVVYECLQTLPEQYREVLFLGYFEGFSPWELSGILKKSPKQVYNLLARAKASLKEKLMQEGIHEDI